MDVEAAAGLARRFLEEFYREEGWEDRAAVRALEAQSHDLRGYFRIATAMNTLLRSELPEGFLREMVESSAGRSLADDAEARAFLERVCENNTFNDPFDPDEFV
ncbi:hypothetical protein [Streptomyces sp. KL110A]|uniref:hypothetical protein n=1 Tax=Streptomyces sp. KL110A TaxID=3384221 RepID=UPI0038C89BA0